MLTCYGDTVRLPENDLAYVAFRLALQETLTDIELYRDLEEEPDLTVGYLAWCSFWSRCRCRYRSICLRKRGPGTVNQTSSRHRSWTPPLCTPPARRPIPARPALMPEAGRGRSAGRCNSLREKRVRAAGWRLAHRRCSWYVASDTVSSLK